MCDVFEDGTPMLRVDYSITCWEGEHVPIVVVAIIMVFIYPIGTPLLYIALLYASRDSLLKIKRAEQITEAETSKLKQFQQKASGNSSKGDSVSNEQGMSLEHRDSMQNTVHSIAAACQEITQLKDHLPGAVRKLTNGYKMRTCWFEVFECLRKLFLTGIPVFFPMGSAAQLICGLIICFVSAVILASYDPYVERSSNTLAKVCQLSLFFAIVSSIALNMQVDESSDELGYLLVFTMFAPHLLGLLEHSGLEIGGMFSGTKAVAQTSLERTLGRFVDRWLKPTEDKLKPTDCCSQAPVVVV